MLASLAVGHVELVVLDVSRSTRLGGPVFSTLSEDAVLPYNLLQFEIDEYIGHSVAYGDDGLVGVGEGSVAEVAHLLHVSVAPGPFVDVVECE